MPSHFVRGLVACSFVPDTDYSRLIFTVWLIELFIKIHFAVQVERQGLTIFNILPEVCHIILLSRKFSFGKNNFLLFFVANVYPVASQSYSTLFVKVLSRYLALEIFVSIYPYNPRQAKDDTILLLSVHYHLEHILLLHAEHRYHYRLQLIAAKYVSTTYSVILKSFNKSSCGSILITLPISPTMGFTAPATPIF